ncbi:hypothetical protein NG800_015615 [Epilithonimonas ginsengisoli]|uniref:GLPGLI family protein n=1 Tax=Epilithonimonas ginsengisoli TaxID=1245592 RepID=A0ABU4JKX4_9FLAO|nr:MULTISPECIES: hypothetical protein [Chryseobacterium group]MBV6881386.1 hypothetical protein [Epilithonimonas sp. FP105]MDW8550354.1 hypothetical protein [Epilithonimonas ginsengisoli]OAH68314.1 hypothetical protein AXA65_17205 [Chryseobacterium sp. FP211-J200]
MKKIYFLLYSLLFINSVNAQEIIPFRITKYNNVIVKTLVNDKDSLDLMFQIAMVDASISPERIRPAKSLTFDKNGISENNSVKIGKKEFKNIRFVDNELTGQEADGKIGTGIFKGKTYKIDYDNNQFVIYDQLPDVKDYKQVSFTYNKQGQIFLACQNLINNESYETNFLLQSGYPGGLLYSNQFADSKKLNEKLKITGEKTLKNSAGQSISTKQGILPTLMIIDDIALQNVSAGFFTGEIKNQNKSYFGADLIRRFNWIFDAETQIIYIKPSKYFNEPYFKMN